MKFECVFDLAIGRVLIGEEAGAITRIGFFKEGEADAQWAQTPLILEACRQLEEYLEGKRRDFSLPLAPKGTPFQERVWQALCEIPFGTTCSYKDIGTAIGNPKASRAVGMANNRNPILIVIPCHRVIGANGKLVGYGGGLSLKEQLLELERENPTS